MSDTPTPAYVISTSISEWASDWQGEPYSYIQIAQEAVTALAAAGFRVVPVPDENVVREAERLMRLLSHGSGLVLLADEQAELADLLARYVLGRDAQ